MRKFLVVLAVLALVASHQVANAEPGWKTHKAAEFVVKYPAGFTAKKTEFGSYFTSPDGLVKFYAYSAWMGSDNDPHPWLAQPGEKTVATSQGTNLRDYGMIQALDKSYLRDYLVVRDGVTPWRVFYIKYTNQRALMKYKKTYQMFIDSFRESGDGGDGR